MNSSTLGLITFGFNLLSSAFVIVIFCVVKFNDLSHIDKKLQELSNKYDKMNDTVSSLSAQISSISGYIQGQKNK